MELPKPTSDAHPPSILFEDHHYIAVNKPAGLLTQAPAGIPSLETVVKEYIREKYAKPGGVYLGVPHRLDRPVSGAIVFARNSKATQRLQVEFAERRVEKTYWALVQGTVNTTELHWEDWMRKVPDEPRAERAEEGQPGAKLAKLEAQVLGTQAGSTWLALKPMTGRMHQLRVQCAWRGHPILGDELYGSAVPFGPRAELPRDRVVALHARALTIPHPFRHEPIVVEAALPAYWPDPNRAGKA